MLARHLLSVGVGQCHRMPHGILGRVPVPHFVAMLWQLLRRILWLIDGAVECHLFWLVFTQLLLPGWVHVPESNSMHRWNVLPGGCLDGHQVSRRVLGRGGFAKHLRLFGQLLRRVLWQLHRSHGRLVHGGVLDWLFLCRWLDRAQPMPRGRVLSDVGRGQTDPVSHRQFLSRGWPVKLDRMPGGLGMRRVGHDCATGVSGRDIRPCRVVDVHSMQCGAVCGGPKLQRLLRLCQRHDLYRRFDSVPVHAGASRADLVVARWGLCRRGARCIPVDRIPHGNPTVVVSICIG